MKKEINSKSKRKWVVGGLAVFASVALLTTGFAIWEVGNSTTSGSGDIGVKVDTAKNSSVSFKMTMSDSNIVLAEAAEVTGGFVNASGAEVVANPLQVAATFTIEWGTDYTFEYTKIQFAFDEAATTAVTVSESKITDRTGSSWTYLAVPEAIAIDSSKATGDSVKTLTVTTTFDFKWGTFFGSVSPCNYYNGIYTAETGTVTDAENIKAELDAMYTALNDKTLKLTAELAK